MRLAIITLSAVTILASAPVAFAQGVPSKTPGHEMQALMLVAERNGPTMLARIGVMRALNRGHVREFNPDGMDHHWGRRKLKRDDL